ncbi:MAG: MFS transporter [Deltaproteobacteria bacterium]
MKKWMVNKIQTSKASSPGSPQSAIRLIFIMCTAEVLNMAGVFTFPALLPRFLEQWELTNIQAGWINGIYFAGYTAAVPVLVSLTDRLDARRIYLTSAGVCVLTAFLFSVLARGFWTALLFRSLGGLGLAGTFIPGLKVLVDRTAGKAQARAIAVYTAAFALGTSLSFFAAGELDARLGWRWAFAFAAASALLALVLAAVTVRPRPLQPEHVPDTHLLDFRPVLRNRKALSFVLAYACHMWELFALRSWVVAFLAFSLSLQGQTKTIWSPSAVVAAAALVAMLANVGGAELAVHIVWWRPCPWSTPCSPKEIPEPFTPARSYPRNTGGRGSPWRSSPCLVLPVLR